MRLLIIIAGVIAAWVLLLGEKGEAGTIPGSTQVPQGGRDGLAPIAPGPADSVQQSSFLDNLDNIVEGWARQEGFYKQGAVPQRSNNPGDIKTRSGDDVVGHTASGIAVFDDVGDGWQTLTDWITSHAKAHPDWDFYDLMSYAFRGSTTAPPVDDQGDSNSAAEYIAGYAGLDPTQTVSSAIGV
jgi:hypothetical protein